MKTTARKFTKLINVVVTMSILAGCHYGYRQKYCPDGRREKYPRNEKSAKSFYADAVKNYDVNLGLLISTINAWRDGTDSIQINHNARLLTEKLDEESVRMRAALETSFRALQQDPCGTSARHYSILDGIYAKQIELREMKIELEHTARTQLAEALENYANETVDGRNMALLTRRLEEYHQKNNQFPKSLILLNSPNVLEEIGDSRLEYICQSPNNVSLRFAGGDYILETVDDQVYIGVDGIVKQTGSSRK